MELGAEVSVKEVIYSLVLFMFSFLNNYILSFLQKVSLLVTEAYKDAHQKSVLVCYTFNDPSSNEDLTPDL